MKKIYTTAMGKQIDFESLKAVNEETIAVGNMKVNARGDHLGPGGSVNRSRNEVIADHYSNVAKESRDEKIQRQRMAGAKVSKRTNTNNTKHQETYAMENTNQTDQDLPQEQTDQPADSNQEETSLPDKKLRGSLADSMAREATVTQEKMRDPRKPRGPSRI